jgi:hypothetical protein
MESIVVMGCMMIILGATHGFLAGGVDFYTRSVQGLEVQQQTLVGLSRMADELENSSFDKIFVPPAPANDAVVFPSPADTDGIIGSNEKGVLLWKSTVCFMKRTLADGTVVIERKVEAHPTLGGVDYPPDPLTIVGGARDIAYFTPLPATSIMARNVAEPTAADPFPFELTKGTDKISITLKVEFSHVSKDTMKVSSQVFPKN